MRAQDLIAKKTEQAVEGIFRTAHTMPQDKLDWKPLDQGRSALDQLQEVTRAATWFSAMLEKQANPEFSEAHWEQARKTSQSWTTLEQCETRCRENTQKIVELIKNCSDDALAKPIQFGDTGETYTLAEAMTFHHQHLTYHHGQINFIQTLYGDSENH